MQNIPMCDGVPVIQRYADESCKVVILAVLPEAGLDPKVGICA
jgi:hypothetical protein